MNMKYDIKQLINIILHKSELLEENIKEKSDLKGITAKQLNCIEIIVSLHNPTLSELSEKLGISRPSTTVMVDRLAEKGFLNKVKADHDRRSAHVHLTEKGIQASELHQAVHIQFASLLTKDLTESEKDILIVLLNKAVRSLG